MRKKYLKNWIRKFILHNVGWKLLSLFFAMFLWFIVMNINNPTETKTYSVNISMLNKDKLEANDFVILNEDQLNSTKIDIKVKGTRAALDELDKKENKENIKAVIDLSQFELLYAQNVDETVKIGVTPSLPDNISYSYQIISYTPSFVEIKLDNVSRKTLPVTVEVTGSAAQGYISSKPEIEPSEIAVIGAESELEKAVSVKVYLDMAYAKSSIETDIVPVILDSDGNVLEKLKAETDSVKVKVSVNKQGQIAVAQPSTSGTPAEGYFVESVDYEPKFVDIIGDEKGISGLSVIELPSVNVDGIAEDKTVVFDIRPYLKNTGLSLKNNDENEILVTVKLGVNKYENAAVPDENISFKNVGEGLTAVIQSNIEVKVDVGDGSEAFDASILKAEIDLNGLNEGVHRVEAAVSGSDKINTDETYYVNVEIKKVSDENLQEASSQQQDYEAVTENTEENPA